MGGFYLTTPWYSPLSIRHFHTQMMKITGRLGEGISVDKKTIALCIIMSSSYTVTHQPLAIERCFYTAWMAETTNLLGNCKAIQLLPVLATRT